MTEPRSPRPPERGDPVGFLLLIVLAIACGGAILFAIQWIVAFFGKAS